MITLFRTLRFCAAMLLGAEACLFPLESFAADDHHSASAVGVSPEHALHMLVEGNQRYISGQSSAQTEYLHRRDANAKGQKPFAIIVCCSDSRVPPEVVFDQGIGDLFVVRSAGHVVDDVALGSIEYAVEHLGSGLILVLGHERCGAVAATCAGGEAPAHIASIVKAIQPSFDAVRAMPGDPIENTLRANVKAVVARLTSNEPVLAPLIKESRIDIKGARYDLDSGKVEIVE
jgi:carbonic anhydrase